MAIVLHLANLIVNKNSISEHYLPEYGEISKYEDFSNKFPSEAEYYQEDDHLISYPALNCDEFHFEEKLQSCGISKEHYVIHSRYGGLLWSCSWLRTAQGSIAWHKGQDDMHDINNFLQSMTIGQVERFGYVDNMVRLINER